MSNKHKVTVEVTFTREYEIDLDSEGYEDFTDIGEALMFDVNSYYEEPAYLLDQEDDLKIKARARVHGTSKYDMLIDDQGEHYTP